MKYNLQLPSYSIRFESVEVREVKPRSGFWEAIMGFFGTLIVAFYVIGFLWWWIMCNCANHLLNLLIKLGRWPQLSGIRSGLKLRPLLVVFLLSKLWSFMDSVYTATTRWSGESVMWSLQLAGYLFWVWHAKMSWVQIETSNWSNRSKHHNSTPVINCLKPALPRSHDRRVYNSPPSIFEYQRYLYELLCTTLGLELSTDTLVGEGSIFQLHSFLALSNVNILHLQV